MAVEREKLRGFYFITDSGLTVNGIAEDVRQAIEAGARLVQYREKAKGFAERLDEAGALLELCRGAGVPFIVNDDVELAKRLGLAGDRIPKAALIVAVADSLDAMTSDRPSRPGRPVTDALEEIAACSGTQFFPDVVAGLMRLHDRNKLPAVSSETSKSAAA